MGGASGYYLRPPQKTLGSAARQKSLPAKSAAVAVTISINKGISSSPNETRTPEETCMTAKTLFDPLVVPILVCVTVLGVNSIQFQLTALLGDKIPL